MFYLREMIANMMFMSSILRLTIMSLIRW